MNDINEIIKRYNKAAELWNPVWERRIIEYSDHIATAILESWKDLSEVIDYLTEDIKNRG